MPDTPWRIRDRSDAEWAARELGRALERLGELDRFIAAETARLEQSVASERRRADATRQRMTALLLDHHARELNALLGRDPDDDTVPTKAEWDKLVKHHGVTLTLTGATVKAKRLPGATTITDLDALIAFLRTAAPELLTTEVTTKVPKVPLDKRLTIAEKDDGTIVLLLDGEPVPGMTPARPEVQLDVEATARRPEPAGVTLTPPDGFDPEPDPTTDTPDKMEAPTHGT